MALMLRAAQILGLLALLLSAWAPISQSLPMQYCAGLNTAPMAANLSIYQSNGLCSDFCRAKGYAFAIVQYQSCWCSNFVPDASTTVSTGRCDMVCPGFGDETCGASGLFGYIALGRAPSGTARASPSNTQGQSQVSHVCFSLCRLVGFP
jgi:cell wall integrity and stress response component